MEQALTWAAWTGVGVLAIGAGVVGWRLWIWLGEKIGTQRRDQLADAVVKVATFAVTQLYPLIRQYGWNSPEVRHKAIQISLDSIEEKFPDAVKTAKKMGVDLAIPMGRNIVMDQIDRVLPEVIAKVADSPASPPKELTTEVIAGGGHIVGVAREILNP